jgi:hypothetical protein
MNAAQQTIKDFLLAVDRGYLGQMPADFNDSAFVKALRDEVAKAEAEDAWSESPEGRWSAMAAGR